MILIPLMAIVSALGACGGSDPKPAVSNGAESSPTTAAVKFASCDAAKAAGYSSIKRGDPGYSSALDRDGDGVACDADKKMTFAECQKAGEYPGGQYAVDFDNGVCHVQKP